MNDGGLTYKTSADHDEFNAICVDQSFVMLRNKFTPRPIRKFDELAIYEKINGEKTGNVVWVGVLCVRDDLVEGYVIVGFEKLEFTIMGMGRRREDKFDATV